MATKFRYRKRSPLGGLAADISAEADTSGTIPGCAVQISGKLWLEVPDAPLHWRDVAWMMYGLSLHSESLNRLHPQGLTVRVQNFSFPMSDYVPEVAAFAMEGWVREEFNLTPASISVEYDTVNSGYVFRWGDGMPFSDEASAIPLRHAW
ncbi:hypothetical protein OHA71_19740 [Streptomyces sp. NBC_00444]|uniref:hypothetical protein n=1 Tax=Streptomyces sp. NBC_00444 TaxID=2975744 RepID=UPI002E1CA94A